MNICKLSRCLFALSSIFFLNTNMVYADGISEEGKCYIQNLNDSGIPVSLRGVIKFKWKNTYKTSKEIKTFWSINDKEVGKYISSEKEKQPNDPIHDLDGQFTGLTGQTLKLQDESISYRINIIRDSMLLNDKLFKSRAKFTFTTKNSTIYNSLDAVCKIKINDDLIDYNEDLFNAYELEYNSKK